MKYLRAKITHEVYVLSGEDETRYEIENCDGGHRIVPKELFDKYFDWI